MKNLNNNELQETTGGDGSGFVVALAAGLISAPLGVTIAAVALIHDNWGSFLKGVDQGVNAVEAVKNR